MLRGEASTVPYLALRELNVEIPTKLATETKLAFSERVAKFLVDELKLNPADQAAVLRALERPGQSEKIDEDMVEEAASAALWSDLQVRRCPLERLAGVAPVHLVHACVRACVCACCRTGGAS